MWKNQWKRIGLKVGCLIEERKFGKKSDSVSVRSNGENMVLNKPKRCNKENFEILQGWKDKLIKKTGA